MFRELDDIFLSNSAPRGVLIVGDPGSGKSALISQLICSPFSSLAIYDNIVGYHVCDYSEVVTRDGASFVRNLVDQIAGNIPEFADRINGKKQIKTHLKQRCNRDPIRCFVATIIAPLKELKIQPNDFKYIVIDGLDECIEKDEETSAILDMFRHKMSLFPRWLKVIMSSQNGTTAVSKVPRAVQRLFLNSGDERNVEDIRSFVSQYLRKKSSISKLWNTIYQLTDKLTKHAEGNFLFVKTVLETSLQNDGMININSMPNSQFDMFDRIFQRYFIKEDSTRFEMLFEVLLAAGSLYEREIIDIFLLQNQSKEVRTLLTRVSSLLRFGQNGTVSLYHQSFAEWLVNSDNLINGFSIQLRRGHNYIAHYLLDTNTTLTFKQLSRLCMHILKSGGPSNEQKKQLALLDVTKIRNQQNGDCILHELARSERGSMLLEIFLPNFSSVDIPDVEGKPPAYYASYEGLVDNLMLFINYGACANCILKNISSFDEIKAAMKLTIYKESSIMHIAAYNGHTKVIRALLQHDASLTKFNQYIPTLLHVAVERGHLDLVELLHHYGVEPDVICLHHAASRNQFHVVKYLLETASVKDECWKCKPVSFPHFRRNKILPEIHDMFCETALHAAVSKRHVNVTKLLLRFGNSSLNCKHYSGKTPLMDAVERNDTEIAGLLLENGANVEEECGNEISLNVREGFVYGKRSLYTVYREKTSCPCGNKALHLSAKYGLWQMARYLIYNWNASVLDKNCFGETVWKIANVSHNQDFIYHVNQMLLSLDESSTSAHLGISKTQRRTFKELLNKFFLRTKPYQSSFQCDSTFEGMSPLHIAALMGVDMLNRVYKKTHEIAPSLPLNCTNKHWITPRYLAYFYDSIHDVTDERPSLLKQTPRGNNDFVNTMLQYPDREAEFHLIYNYFYDEMDQVKYFSIYQIFKKSEERGITNCPGYYEMPTKKALEPSCDKYDSETEEDDDSIPEDDTTDSGQSCTEILCQETSNCVIHWVPVVEEWKEPTELEEVVFDQTKLKLTIEEIYLRIKLDEYMIDCGCPRILSTLQGIFTQLPKKNRYVNQFISERMGWKETSSDGEILKRWPLYFFHKKLRNEYQSYKYLEALSEGFKLKRRRSIDLSQDEND